MNLKNYTSSVPAERSITMIERKLVAMGAKNINKEYEDGLLVGIKFLIDVNGKSVYFELPAKVDRVHEVLMAQYKKPTAKTEQNCIEQAERTAWKIMYEWLCIQHSMIELEQADVLQVLLPYALINPTTTVYQAIQAGGLKMLAENNS